MISRAAGVGIGFALLAASVPARGDESDAAAQFDYGRSEMMGRRYATGCPALKSSFQLDPRPGTLFTLAECDLQWGKVASALASYEQYLALYDRMSSEQKTRQAERARIASAERASLESSVPRLSVRVPEGAPAGVVIQRDDVVLGGPMLGAAIPVDPGEHVVRVRMPDGRVDEQRVALVGGEQRVVVARLPAPDEPAAPASSPVAAPAPLATRPPLSSPEPSTVSGGHASRRRWIFAAGGVALAGGIVAGVAGGLALAKKSTAESDCTSQGSQAVCASQQGVDAGNAARGLANAETVALAVAGVGVVAALVLWLTEPHEPRASAARGARLASLSSGVGVVW
jgi:hypothetical protein